jgi:biopolymer transport protein ExbD
VLVPVACLVALGLLAYGCEEDVEPDSTEPVVGLMEVPVSLRHGDTRPDNPLNIEIAPAELRLDGRKVLDLTAGQAPESQRGAEGLPKLKSAIEGGGSRKAAAIRMHANAPYETMVAVLDTLSRVGVGDVAFEVRKPGGTEPGWMHLGEHRVVDPSDEPVTFAGGAQRSWDEVVQHWSDMYATCRNGKYVDCDGKSSFAAKGGQAALTLMARGQAVKISFDRFGGDDEEEEEAPKKAQVAMIEGVPAPSEGDDEPEVEPVTHAVFTWKLSEATKEDSAISLTMRPLCGAKPCGALVRAEYATPGMRTLSLIGAAFPDGATAPVLMFERPRR